MDTFFVLILPPPGMFFDAVAIQPPKKCGIQICYDEAGAIKSLRASNMNPLHLIIVIAEAVDNQPIPRLHETSPASHIVQIKPTEGWPNEILRIIAQQRTDLE